jgi:adenylate kinase family enzyme
METVKRVVIVGPGAAGKSTLAANLGEITGLPVIGLDKLFWRPASSQTPRDRWAAIQHELVTQDLWIMDGDLGPYDVIDVRLRAADTIVFLDFSSVRCAWRAIRRSRERADFWRWLWTYRSQSRPQILQAITAHAASAGIHLLPTPRAVTRFLAQTAREAADPSGDCPALDIAARQATLIL